MSPLKNIATGVDPQGLEKSGGGPAGVLYDDLESLAAEIRKALDHADWIKSTAPLRDSVEVQRNLLHLRVRLQGIAREIDDAVNTLHRISRPVVRADVGEPQYPPPEKPGYPHEPPTPAHPEEPTTPGHPEEPEPAPREPEVPDEPEEPTTVSA